MPENNGSPLDPNEKQCKITYEKSNEGLWISLLKAQIRILLKYRGGVEAGSICREMLKRLTTEGIKTFQQADVRDW